MVARELLEVFHFTSCVRLILLGFDPSPLKTVNSWEVFQDM